MVVWLCAVLRSNLLVSDHYDVSFFTELNFFQIFGAYPVPWAVTNKTMPFFSHINCFIGSRTRDKILENATGREKKIRSRFHIGGPKGSP